MVSVGSYRSFLTPVCTILLFVCWHKTVRANLLGNSPELLKCQMKCKCLVTCRDAQVVPMIQSNVTVFYLKIEESNITILFNNTFELARLNKLQRLEIMGSKLGTIEIDAFRQLVDLDTLNLERNNFVELNLNLFEKNLALRELILDKNHKLTTLIGTFPSLPHLTKLDLSRASISYLHINTFRELGSLKTLNLAGNSLVGINVNLFRFNIKLILLWMDSNTKLTKLTGGSFPSLPQLTHLSLSQCNLSQLKNGFFHRLASMQYLNLAGNEFITIDVNVFKNNTAMKELCLNSNKNLTKLIGGPFPLPQLIKLKLNDCNLSELANNTFENLTSLQELDLSTNKFKTIPVEIFLSCKELRKLDLESNPWQCDCQLKRFWEFYIRQTRPSYDHHLMCSQPDIQANRTWDSLWEALVCSTDSNPSTIISISISTVAIVCIIAATAAYSIIRKNNLVGLSESQIKLFKTGNPDVQGNDTLSNIENMSYNQRYEIHRSRFTWDPTDVLGKGSYGVVYKGTYIHKRVAIKTIQASNRNADSVIYLRSLLSEIKVMCYLDENDSVTTSEHIGKLNIVSIIGASTKDIRKGVFLICEFCELGCLEKYLREHRQKFHSIVLYSNVLRNEPMKPLLLEEQVITTVDLTRWAYEIGNGMSYISSRHVIHGDLASRNVLLTKHRIAKIADFGLSRRLYEYSTYTKKNQEPLPWRWMATESLKDLTFSSQSDIWSYGITLWEIFSLAQVPYPGLNWTNDFVKELEQGLRPNRPEYANDKLYNLMQKTWVENPSERLSFEEIRSSMRIILEEYLAQNYETVIALDDVNNQCDSVNSQLS